ncbi:hypothetical protein [Spirosoma linguale]|uniref:Uncharacterized protein n=1 Tax=Spirosoma linguale (strain ATCC 33905 / DSM 74 / LMG 10896 / Claus 1) TaxID=504472 RepID=D2QPR5_SPILD|nr:hypothetical protein Slin_4746 [Spirosoma linguale DSM 74]
METTNPFKELEPDGICPPHLQHELVTEIDLIRNTITIIEIYIGDLFSLVSVLANPPHLTSNDTTNSIL